MAVTVSSIKAASFGVFQKPILSSPSRKVSARSATAGVLVGAG